MVYQLKVNLNKGNLLDIKAINICKDLDLYYKLFIINSDEYNSEIFVRWYFRYLVTSDLITINLNNPGSNRRKIDLRIRRNL